MHPSLGDAAPVFKMAGALLEGPRDSASVSGSEEGLGARAQTRQLQSHVHGPDGEELWARAEKELVSFPPTMARMGPRALNREGCE